MATVQLNGNWSQGTTKAREHSLAEWCLDSENITTTIKSAEKPHGKRQNYTADATALDSKVKREEVIYNQNKLFKIAF